MKEFSELQEAKDRGARIRRIREEAGMNKQDFGREIGVSPAYMTYLESGEKQGGATNPSRQLLFLIAHRFGVNMEWLEDGTGPMRLSLRQELIAIMWSMDEERLRRVREFIRELGGEEEPETPGRIPSKTSSGFRN